MSLDHPSYVAALHWSAATPSEEQSALELLGRLRYHWLSNGRQVEGRMRIEAMLEAVSSPSAARGTDLVDLRQEAWTQPPIRTSRP
ncbi:hypothetical protein BVC93_18765 [Mycobacterium sp. MS1601]|uniref:hypothetical protein n=1 Tax=Mycobacterium sp. MS1601 TaxID=1936029 RepID=UPI0009795A50|nr:hypothetical protein [Mycobacterium sp. MS1601]AQA04133.1 hypothetical protein BVC93_18765 [Mycobacterium sp. MS1601]